MKPNSSELLSSILFFLAIIHTFFVSRIERIARRYPSKSFLHKFLHLFSEVELVFAFWAILFLLLLSFQKGPGFVVSYLSTLHFYEPLFVLVIMCIASAKPIISWTEKMIHFLARFIPFVSERMSLYIVTLTIGPILGSFITEPAAMTVTAFIILKSFYQSHSSQRLKYATIALLFVNVSIGGTLTHFAAPPVLMVSKAWSWDTPFMFKHFGYKALVAILLSTFFYAALLKNELLKPIDKNLRKFSYRWSFKGPVLVSLFLSGLIILGSMQAWWLKALLVNLSEHLLFIGAAGLTSITDNASLTYLGTLVDLSASAKYALVAGAVSGGGLTVIANAPNPVGFGILRGSFGPEGINPIQLFLWAIIPTIIALACFFLLPNL